VDTKDARKAQEKMEVEITVLIQQFEGQTGCSVEGVTLSYHTSNDSFRTRVCNVHAQVRL
jgi:hypothetical protein